MTKLYETQSPNNKMLNQKKIEEIKRFFFEDQEIDVIKNIQKNLKNTDDVSDEELIMKFNRLISDGRPRKKNIMHHKEKQVVILSTNENKPKRKNYTPSEVSKVWRNIYGNEFDDVLCKICESTKISFEDRRLWHMSHLISHEAGGTSDIDNIRPLCTICNHSMHKKSLIEYCTEKYDSERCKKIFSALKIL